MITTNKGKKQKIVIVSSPHLISNHHTLTVCLLPTISFQTTTWYKQEIKQKSSVILLLSAMANFSLILGYCKLES